MFLLSGRVFPLMLFFKPHIPIELIAFQSHWIAADNADRQFRGSLQSMEYAAQGDPGGSTRRTAASSVRGKDYVFYPAFRSQCYGIFIAGGELFFFDMVSIHPMRRGSADQKV